MDFRKKINVVVIIVFVLLFPVGCGSHVGGKYSPGKSVHPSAGPEGVEGINTVKTLSLNDVELLKADQVMNLLNGNGFVFEKADSLPEGMCAKPEDGVTPDLYFDKNKGLYLCLYVFDSYDDRPYPYAEIDSIVDRVAGKNIILDLRFPKWSESGSVSGIDPVMKKEIIDVTEEIWNVMFNNAFEGTHGSYMGFGENWSVVIPFKYYNNRQVVQDIAGNYVYRESFDSRGEIFIKYNGKNEQLYNVNYLFFETEGVKGAAGPGRRNSHVLPAISDDKYFSTGFDFRNFRVDKDNSVIVEIHWNDGKKEVVNCKWSSERETI